MTETYQSYLVVQLPLCVELLERLEVLPEDGDVRLQERVSIGLRRKKHCKSVKKVKKISK